MPHRPTESGSTDGLLVQKHTPPSPVPTMSSPTKHRIPTLMPVVATPTKRRMTKYAPPFNRMVSQSNLTHFFTKEGVLETMENFAKQLGRIRSPLCYCFATDN